jgi:GTP diphosphokinase / guanosine-3',5'-bis(diphosphate) 3'-diphosphatase
VRTPTRSEQQTESIAHMNGASLGSSSQAVAGEPMSLRLLLDTCARYLDLSDLALIHQAYGVAAEAHRGVKRKSGDPFIEHPLAVARILAELAMDARGIAAALLHDTVEDTAVTLEQVQDQFGEEIATIVDGVTKFDAMDLSDEPQDVPPPVLDSHGLPELKARQKAETVRKLFMTMMRDPRVVLLKLADRLHNMRTLEFMEPAKRELISRETLEIYAPLAGRIGLYVFKSELEDLAFSYLHPTAYALTIRRMRDETMKRTSWAQRLCERMQKELAERGIPAAVNWRTKHAYRAYVEARESGMDIALLHDLIAFRVLVTQQAECYQALGIIHHLWHPYPERIRDYIASPKINGYQSLHTAVFALDGRLAQIHIRTHRMHRAAQHGVAAFWLERAEAGVCAADDALPWLQHLPLWIGQLANWQRELKLSASDFVDTLRGEVFEDQVFISTPKGDVRELPAGATVLDLAYQIHTGIGDRATGAHILTNGADGVIVVRDVPLGYVLRTGDIVRVTTSVDAWPRAEWLTIAATRYARERIARALRRGTEKRSAREIPTAETEPGLPSPLAHPSGRPAQVILARCCYPCPGDKIAGLAERGRLVTIHRACCRTLRHALARRRARGASYPEPIRATWEEIQPVSYHLRLAIYGQDHRGLMYEVSSRIAELGLNLENSSASAHRERYKAAILLTVAMPPNIRQEAVIRRLRGVPGVVQIERDLRKGCDEARL